MSLPKPKEDPLQALIENKQWRQAFNLCEKKLKKGDKSDLLQAIRISTLLRWGDTARQQQGRKELNVLLSNTPPVTNPATLEVLDTIAVMIEDEPRLHQTWERAVGAQPDNEMLHKEWYQRKFDLGDLKGIQKAAQVWMKNFPKRREPFFLYIVANHRLAGHVATPESEQKLFQNLAYRCLVKAVAEVPPPGSNNSDPPPRSIVSAEDYLILLRVYREQRKYEEAISFLEDPRTGIPRFNNPEWELARQLVELYELCGNWQGEWDFCQKILEDARRDLLQEPFKIPTYDFGKLGDDWKIWEGLLTACRNINTQEISTRTEDVARSFHVGDKGSRNAHLALLKFCYNETIAGRFNQDAFLTICQEHYRRFSIKTTCFHDLHPFLPGLERSSQEQFMVDTAEYSQTLRPRPESSASTKVYWITSELNALKLEYHLVVSRDDNSVHVDVLSAFVNNCLRLYKVSLEFDLDLPVSDRQPGDDAAILAAMGLVRLYKAGQGNAILRTVFVLEFLTKHSKHNYDALLILVRLHMFLGTGSWAMKSYHDLSIKNLQHATVSWILFTRISTIHPWPITMPTTDSKRRATVDPLDEVTQALKWFEIAQDLNFKSVRTMQKKSEWNMSLDGLTTQDYLETSSAKYHLLIEQQRIARLRSSPHEVDSRTWIDVPPQTTETRDKTAFPNYEAHGQLTFEEILPIAGSMVGENRTRPDDEWLSRQISLAAFWDSLHNGGVGALAVDSINLNTQSSRPEPAASTDDELGVGSILYKLRQLVHIFCFKGLKHHPNSVEGCIRELMYNLENWIFKSSENLSSIFESSSNASTALIPGLSIPIWNYFHTLYMHLELCQFVMPAMDYIIRENRKRPLIELQWLDSRTARLREACTRLSVTVRRLATELQDKLHEDTTTDKLMQAVLGSSSDVVGQGLGNNIERSDMEQLCKYLQESWIEGLEGVIRTKMS